jgi:hypothetical protein
MTTQTERGREGSNAKGWREDAFSICENTHRIFSFSKFFYFTRGKSYADTDISPCPPRVRRR